MLIAQAPGKKEDEEGRMFIGPSGKVLDELLHANNVNRYTLYMTNLVKCMLPKNRKPKQDEINLCSQYLDEEIELINPTVMAPLGHYATTYLFQKYDLPVPLKPEFHRVYGKLILTDRQKILPLQHPATVVYNPLVKPVLQTNYHKLQVLSRECKWYQVCPLRRFYEKRVIEKTWIELYCEGDWESCVRYHLEEKGEPHDDFMLPDGTLNSELCEEE
jgi:DNA polymerase